MRRIGKIWPSKLPVGAPILFIPKAHGKGLSRCVDYQGLNKITVLNRYLLHIMNKLRNWIQGTKLCIRLTKKLGIILSESVLAMNGRQPSGTGMHTMSIW
jgi:hypothetical protein